MWLRKRKVDQCESHDVRQAREEAAKAEERKRKVDAQWDSVERISGTISFVLGRNHFGEQLTRAALRRNTT